MKKFNKSFCTKSALYVSLLAVLSMHRNVHDVFGEPDFKEVKKIKKKGCKSLSICSLFTILNPPLHDFI